MNIANKLQEVRKTLFSPFKELWSKPSYTFVSALGRDELEGPEQAKGQVTYTLRIWVGTVASNPQHGGMSVPVFGGDLRIQNT